MRFGPITTGIVSNGLIYNVDPSNPASYSGTGNTANNTINNTNPGTLFNDLGHLGENSGIWDFDGVTSYLQLSPNITTSYLTYSIWYKPSSTDTHFRNLGNTGAWHSTEFACFSIGNHHSYVHQLSLRTKSSNGITNTLLPGQINPNYQDTWHNATFVVEPSNQSIYYNGQLCESTTRTNNTDITINNLTIGNQMGYGYYGGKVASTHMYNRALSANEVLHNYNALKSRFE